MDHAGNSTPPFSNIKIPTSPDQDPPVQVRYPQKGNLTGIPRKVRDNCAELSNAIQQWNGLLIEGGEAIRAITAITLESKSANEQEDKEDTSTSTDRANVINWNLQESCKNLTRIHQNMGSLVKKMQLISSQFEALTSLCTTTETLMESFSSTDKSATEHSDPIPLFHTMGLGDYFDSARFISQAYIVEHDSKRVVVEEIAHVTDRNSATFMLASWIHEPFICRETTTKLECMLLDSGYRFPLWP